MTGSDDPDDGTRYRLRLDASVTRITDDRVAVVTGDGTEELRGPVTASLPALADRLETGQTVAELAETLAVERDRLNVALAALHRLGVLVTDGTDDARVPPWVATDSSGSTVSPAVVRHPACGDRGDRLPEPTHPDAIGEALDDGDGDPLVTLTPGSFPAFHRDCLDCWRPEGRTWLPVRLVADEIRIGPVHDRQTTGCVDCAFERTVRSASTPAVERARARHVEATGPGYEYTVGVQRLATQRATASLRHGTHAGARAGRVVRVSVETAATESHDVLPVAGCPVCR